MKAPLARQILALAEVDENLLVTGGVDANVRQYKVTQSQHDVLVVYSDSRRKARDATTYVERSFKGSILNTSCLYSSSFKAQKRSSI